MTAPGKTPTRVGLLTVRPAEPWPEMGGLWGSLAEVYLPDASWKGWERLAVQWAVVEASKLIPSHDPASFAPDKRYPIGVQERDYSGSSAERAKVASQVASFSARLLLSDAPSAVDGPPVVHRKGWVLGGNSRTMTAQLVYAGKGAAALKDAVVEYLGRSRTQGDFPREALLKMKAPLLVRVVVDADEKPARLRHLSAALNRSLTQSLDPTREAVSAAARLDVAAVQAIAILASPEDSLSEALRGELGRQTLAELRRAGVITSRMEPALVDAGGKNLNEAGRLLAVRVFASLVVQDPELLDALGDRWRGWIARSAPHILAAGASGHDVRLPLLAALYDLQGQKSSGKSREQWDLDLPLALGDPRDRPQSKDALAALCSDVVYNHQGDRKFPAVWAEFSKLAQQPGTGQPDLLQHQLPTLEVLRLALEAPARRELAERRAEDLRRSRMPKQSNPSAEVWVYACDEEHPDRQVNGPWHPGTRDRAEIARTVARQLKASVVVFWSWSLDGGLVPVERRAADGTRRADPRLLVANPSPSPAPLPPLLGTLARLRMLALPRPPWEA